MIFASVAVYFPGVSVLEDSEKTSNFCGDVIFFFEDKAKSQEVNAMGKTKLFQLSAEEDSHLIHTQNNF